MKRSEAHERARDRLPKWMCADFDRAVDDYVDQAEEYANNPDRPQWRNYEILADLFRMGFGWVGPDVTTSLVTWATPNRRTDDYRWVRSELPVCRWDEYDFIIDLAELAWIFDQRRKHPGEPVTSELIIRSGQLRSTRIFCDLLLKGWGWRGMDTPKPKIYGTPADFYGPR